ncbi:hypothetical protein KMP13_04700 [Epibacterium ulvae]|uniref:hypothetical protein n=1 Tax=Epibacterium ulvae TaxID=1156985 RepID=UPI001BFCA9D6|nr:hypothetical protein [Epibacterium ulvae]MBT8153198.1 hypothetical protein [Epibacterium ulvae]
MLRVVIFLCFASGVAACTLPTFEMSDKNGRMLFQGRQGLCVVGCNLRLKRSDGVKCSGYTVGLKPNRPHVFQVKCPDTPLQSFTTEGWSFEETNVGVLEAEKPLNESNRAALEAALNQLN